MSFPTSQYISNVFIVEDHKMVRHVMNQLILRIPDLNVCGEAASAEEALVQIPTCSPELVLIDISLPGMNGIELIRILHEKYPTMLLLALSGHEENVYGATVIRAGARGYVMKGNMEKVKEAIQCVRNGEIYVSEQLRSTPDSSV